MARGDIVENLLNIKETSELLGVSISTLNRWRKNKEHLPYLKLGHRIMYSVDDIEKVVETKRIKNKTNERMD